MSIESKNKKKTPIKKIIIEDEMHGKPIAYRKKIEKKLDITTEIKSFLDNPISIEAIKYLLMRFENIPTYSHSPKATLKIYGLPHAYHQDYCIDFLFILDTKRFVEKYHLNYGLFTRLGFLRDSSLCTSPLKRDLFSAIQNWLNENHDQFVKL